MPLDSTFADLDAAVSTAFATDVVSYSPKNSTDPVLTIKFIPLDPLRQEGVAPGQATLRWARLLDFGTVVPGPGDTFLTAAGATYIVNQVQADVNGAVRLVVTKKGGS